MPSQVFNRHYWSARELVVLGVFSAAAKLSTLLVALVGGGMNPVSLLAKNLIFTTLLVVMLYKVRKPGTLALFVLVNMLISMLLLGGSVTLLPAMLLAAGILSNANQDQYEAARIDGANAVQQFWYLTLPFVVFATTPVLITQFIGNFNNFGIFYFLRGGLYIDGYFLASDTDLLINWLYNLSIDNNYYSIGAAISRIIFIITSAISLAVYVFSPSYRQEETYR